MTNLVDLGQGDRLVGEDKHRMNPKSPVELAVERLEGVLQFALYSPQLRDDVRTVLAALQPLPVRQPMKMLVDSDWLARKVATDPDVDVEVRPLPVRQEEPHGEWVLVPREMTPEMRQAVIDSGAFAETNAIIAHHAARTGTSGLSKDPIPEAYAAIIAAAAVRQEGEERALMELVDAAVRGPDRIGAVQHERDVARLKSAILSVLPAKGVNHDL